MGCEVTMPAHYEYKVVPAPRTPAKVRGVKGEEARFAFTVEGVINATAAEGWEFLRSETLPCETRGWLRRSSRELTLLVFRRGRGEVVAEAPLHGTLRLPPEPRLATGSAPRPVAGFAALRATRDGDPD